MAAARSLALRGNMSSTLDHQVTHIKGLLNVLSGIDESQYNDEASVCPGLKCKSGVSTTPASSPLVKFELPARTPRPSGSSMAWSVLPASPPTLLARALAQNPEGSADRQRHSHNIAGQSVECEAGSTWIVEAPVNRRTGTALYRPREAGVGDDQQPSGDDGCELPDKTRGKRRSSRDLLP